MDINHSSSLQSNKKEGPRIIGKKDILKIFNNKKLNK